MRHKRQNPVKVKKLELQYSRSLSNIAAHVAHMIEGFTYGIALADIDNLAIQGMMNRYIDSLIPWATKTAVDFITATGIQDEKAWQARSNEISAEIKREIRETDTGVFMREMVKEQVELIKSIPKEAAERVHRLCIEGLENGTRSTEMINEIMRTGQVTRNRAKLIARTETARTASKFTQIRATQLGSEGYIWRTSKDSDVRSDHKRLEGQYFKWDSPPQHNDGHSYHPGCFCNCRCYPEVVLKD